MKWSILKIKKETTVLIKKFTDSERSEMFLEFSKSIANANQFASLENIATDELGNKE